MVNVNIVILFTRVPTNETLAVALDKLAADPLQKERTYILKHNLMEMMTFWVKTTYFRMGYNKYPREKELSIDPPLSPVLANIYMEYLKEMTQGSTSLKSSMWLR